MQNRYSIEKGIQEFGDTGVKALLDELKQFNDQKVLDTVHVSDLQNLERE
jgi:hypothetical protein